MSGVKCKGQVMWTKELGGGTQELGRKGADVQTTQLWEEYMQGMVSRCRRCLATKQPDCQCKIHYPEEVPCTTYELELQGRGMSSAST